MGQAQVVGPPKRTFGRLGDDVVQGRSGRMLEGQVARYHGAAEVTTPLVARKNEAPDGETTVRAALLIIMTL